MEGKAKAAVQWARKVLEGEHLCRRWPAVQEAHGLQHVKGRVDALRAQIKRDDPAWACVSRASLSSLKKQPCPASRAMELSRNWEEKLGLGIQVTSTGAQTTSSSGLTLPGHESSQNHVVTHPEPRFTAWISGYKG